MTEHPTPTQLVCPVCGGGDDLVSYEYELVGFHGTRFFVDPGGGEAIIDYDVADQKFAADGGRGFEDDIQCRNHGWDILELNLADLVPEGTEPNPDWKPPPVTQSEESEESEESSRVQTLDEEE